jgi:hypothetical protein
MHGAGKVLTFAAVCAAAVAAQSGPAAAAPPQGVALPIPAAPYVRVLPGCVWPTGSKSLTITRRVGQAFNLVNLSASPRVLHQAAGAAGPLPLGVIRHRQAVALVWQVRSTVVLTTCGGTLKLIVKIGV